MSDMQQQGRKNTAVKQQKQLSGTHIMSRDGLPVAHTDTVLLTLVFQHHYTEYARL